MVVYIWIIWITLSDYPPIFIPFDAVSIEVIHKHPLSL